MQATVRPAPVFVFYLRISVALTVSLYSILEVCPFPRLPYYTYIIAPLPECVNL